MVRIGADTGGPGIQPPEEEPKGVGSFKLESARIKSSQGPLTTQEKKSAAERVEASKKKIDDFYKYLDNKVNKTKEPISSDDIKNLELLIQELDQEWEDGIGWSDSYKAWDMPSRQALGEAINALRDADKFLRDKFKENPGKYQNWVLASIGNALESIKNVTKPGDISKDIVPPKPEDYKGENGRKALDKILELYKSLLERKTAWTDKDTQTLIGNLLKLKTLCEAAQNDKDSTSYQKSKLSAVAKQIVDFLNGLDDVPNDKIAGYATMGLQRFLAELHQLV